MPVFAYRAFTASGGTTAGVLDAESAVAARTKLRDMGLLPTEVTETAAAAARQSASLMQRLFPPRINERDLALFTRQMAVLLEAGMPLVDGLEAVMEQIDNPRLAEIVLQLKETVSQGGSYSAALAKFPRWFSALYINMVRAGEAAGALEVVLGRLADYMERRGQVRRRVRAAMTYPALMSVVGLGVLTFLLAYIVPQVTRIFLEMGRELPMLTQILLAISGFVHSWWWAMALALTAAVLAIRAYLGTPRGRAQWDTVRLRFPVLRRLTVTLVVGRFARTLGTLLQSGVPLLDALDIVRNVVNHSRFEDAITETQECVRKGEDLAGALRRTALFPPIVLHMVALGERSGRLEQMLLKTADTAEDDLEADLTSLVALLEPAMIIVMGAVTGFVVLSILLPIFDLNSQFG